MARYETLQMEAVRRMLGADRVGKARAPEIVYQVLVCVPGAALHVAGKLVRDSDKGRN